MQEGPFDGKALRERSAIVFQELDLPHSSQEFSPLTIDERGDVWSVGSDQRSHQLKEESFSKSVVGVNRSEPLVEHVLALVGEVKDLLVRTIRLLDGLRSDQPVSLETLERHVDLPHIDWGPQTAERCFEVGLQLVAVNRLFRQQAKDEVSHARNIYLTVIRVKGDRGAVLMCGGRSPPPPDRAPADRGTLGRMGPRILFIGGTGVISSACVETAVAAGFEVAVLNRGATHDRPIPTNVEELVGDIRDSEATDAALDKRRFDVVVDFLSFTPDHVEAHLARWRGEITQYVFISSASAYQTPPSRVPIVESTPLRNPFWQYSRDKIACEDLLVAAHRSHGFPVTIVRPSHTYDKTMVPFDGGWTVMDRMRRGVPIVVHGDGTSLWTLTHHSDFARAFVGLLGDQRVIGDAFHITSDEVLTWDQIALALGDAAGVEPQLVHVPSEAIAALDPEWGAGLLGDKAHSMIFDNSKIKRVVPGWAATVPFWRGARQIIEWHDEDPARAVVNNVVDEHMNRLVEMSAVEGRKA